MAIVVKDLSVAIAGRTLVDHVSIHVDDGERVGLIGSSGSGKSLISRAVTGLTLPSTKVTGTVLIDGRSALGMSDAQRAGFRGRNIGFIFQNPSKALSPVLSIGRQIGLPLQLHYDLSDYERHQRVLAIMERVGLDRGLYDRFPHELSGGQQQRAAIAAALISSPRLIIADEPTTALDAMTQRQVVDLLVSLVDDLGAGLLFITHDFAVLARATTRSYVLSEGRLVEEGDTLSILRRPKTQEARALVNAARFLSLTVTDDTGRGDAERKPADRAHLVELVQGRPQDRPVGGANGGETDEGADPKPLLRCEGIVKTFRDRSPHARGFAARMAARFSGRGERAEVLHGVSLSVGADETVAVIGGSGSGKTTLTRILFGLDRPDAGIVRFEGRSVLDDAKTMSSLYNQTGLVFQDPYGSLDPRWTIGRSVAEPLEARADGRSGKASDIRARVEWALRSVSLDPRLASRYPSDLSGGQAQRAAIARAIVSRPSVLLADEPMSAIDVAARMQVIDALASLRTASHEQGRSLAIVVVSHDLGVVRRIADRIVVIHDGRIVEQGPTTHILRHPSHAYTKRLIDAASLAA